MNESLVSALVKESVAEFANSFKTRHLQERQDSGGVINSKIHNVFIQALGEETQFYSALVRSLDSSLGVMLEKLAIGIAKLSYEVQSEVSGPLTSDQITTIAQLLQTYKNREVKPTLSDYQFLRTEENASGETSGHNSDYYLIDHETGTHILIELKIGGDLDNKKARSEKEAIMEQYAILSNTLPCDTPIRTYFATAYNRFGEGKPWNQERVKQFFAEEELLIGKNFWNFICKSPKGYDWVLNAYRAASDEMKTALNIIKSTYLGEEE